VFALLAVVVAIEAGWWLQPFWRGMFLTTVVLAEAEPAGDLSAVESSPILLDRAVDALMLGRWPEASAALDRAVALDPSPPAAQIAAARTLLELHQLDEAVRRARLARPPHRR
jgi:predicted Zn-dependent protease